MATNNATNTATGASGTVLQGAGVGTAPTFSTATYPATATSTGTILRADGTNWSATTATYPNTGGTSGNVLTSDGTNFTSAVPAIFLVSGSLTSAQIKALHGTPIQIVAAPGAGKFIMPIYAGMSFKYGGNNVFVAGAAQVVAFYYGTAISLPATTEVVNATLVGSTSKIIYNSTAIATTATSSLDNLAINIYNAVATEISGNANNDNTIEYQLFYQIFTE